MLKKKYKIIIFILAIIIIILAIIIITKSRVNTIIERKRYYKCNDRHNPPLDDILYTENFERQLQISSTMNPDLYLPCGYGGVELELFNLPREQVTKTKIFAISGCDILASKDTLWHTLEKHYSRDGAKLLMPETYLTKSKTDLELFQYFYNPKYIYILKKNIQRKKGIVILDNYINILNTIKLDPRYVIIQHYITNPFLIQKRKINIRLYIAVVCSPSTDSNSINKKVYLYKHGKCLYTNQEYAPNNIKNLEAHLTSLNLNIQIYEHLPETLFELQNYIGNSKYILIWKKIIYKLNKIFLAIQKDKAICNDIKGTVNFQLFGLDVMLDDKMEPWILEFNKGPDMLYKTQKDKKLKTQLQQDLFCLVNLVNKCYTEADTWQIII